MSTSLWNRTWRLVSLGLLLSLHSCQSSQGQDAPAQMAEEFTFHYDLSPRDRPEVRLGKPLRVRGNEFIFLDNWLLPTQERDTERRLYNLSSAIADAEKSETLIINKTNERHERNDLAFRVGCAFGDIGGEAGFESAVISNTFEESIYYWTRAISGRQSLQDNALTVAKDHHLIDTEVLAAYERRLQTNPNERTAVATDFTDRYGTHFVSTIAQGYSVLLRAHVEGFDRNERAVLSSRFNVGFINGSYRTHGDLSVNGKTATVSLRAYTKVENGEASPFPQVAAAIADENAEALQRVGAVRFAPADIEFIATPFFRFFEGDYPKLSDALERRTMELAHVELRHPLWQPPQDGVFLTDSLKVFRPELVNDQPDSNTHCFHNDGCLKDSSLYLDLGEQNEKSYRGVLIGADAGANGENPPHARWSIEYYDEQVGDYVMTGAVANMFIKVRGGGTYDVKVTWPDVGAHRYWRLRLVHDAGPGGYHNRVTFFELPEDH